MSKGFGIFGDIFREYTGSSNSLQFSENYTAQEYRQGVKSIVRAISTMMLDDCRVELTTPEGPDATIVLTRENKRNVYGIQIMPHVAGSDFRTKPIYDRWLYYAMLDFYKKLKSEYVPANERYLQTVISFIDKVKDPEYLTKKEKQHQIDQAKKEDVKPIDNKLDGIVVTSVSFGNGPIPQGISIINTAGPTDTTTIGITGSNGGLTSSMDILNNGLSTHKSLLSEVENKIDNIQDIALDNLDSIRDIRMRMVKKCKSSARTSLQKPGSFRRRMYK